MPPHPANRRAYLAASAVVLFFLALLPARFGSWMNAIGDKAFLLVGPVTAPIYRAVRWISPNAAVQSDEVAALKTEADKWRTLYLNDQVVIADLNRKLDALHANLIETPQAQLVRPVIGATAEPGGLIEIRAGSRDGVEVNSVVTTVGVQLVGRVVNVDRRLCHVRLINNRASGKTQGRVMVNDTTPGPQCLLYPLNNGLLQGFLSLSATDKLPGIGQLVRLDDDKWPRSAQMLVIGSVTHIDQDSTGRWYVTVEPTTDLERLSEVVLRIAPPEADDRGSRATPSTDGSGP